MLKRILLGIFTAVLVASMGAAAYGIVDVQAAGVPVQETGRGGWGNNGTTTNPGGTSTGTTLSAIPASDLNDAERAALIFMREEEKLARDVYNALAAKWNVQTFSRIAASEQTHMDQIGALLVRYNLPDPALSAGKFTNSQLQALYDKLVAQGSTSLAEAYKVGGAIEEIDILDLQARLTQTDNADIKQVYNSLMTASYNHLNAFARAYTSQTGQAYTPQVLSAEQFQVISGTSAGNGNSGSSQNQPGRGGRR